MKHRYQKLYSATLKILTNTVFALAWHWHWCWHWHSCRSSYRVGQRPSLIRRRVPWGILRRVPWVLWSVVIGRLRWCWCTLCINWWLCCKYATKNLKQGSKIRSGLEKNVVLVTLHVQNVQCKYLPKQQRFTKHGNLHGITQQERIALCTQMYIHVPFMVNVICFLCFSGMPVN